MLSILKQHCWHLIFLFFLFQVLKLYFDIVYLLVDINFTKKTYHRILKRFNFIQLINNIESTELVFFFYLNHEK